MDARTFLDCEWKMLQKSVAKRLGVVLGRWVKGGGCEEVLPISQLDSPDTRLDVRDSFPRVTVEHKTRKSGLRGIDAVILTANNASDEKNWPKIRMIADVSSAITWVPSCNISTRKINILPKYANLWKRKGAEDRGGEKKKFYAVTTRRVDGVKRMSYQLLRPRRAVPHAASYLLFFSPLFFSSPIFLPKVSRRSFPRRLSVCPR